MDLEGLEAVGCRLSRTKDSVMLSLWLISMTGLALGDCVPPSQQRVNGPKIISNKTVYQEMM